MSFDEGNKGTLRAPFPYFGGKRRAAAEVWRRLGDPSNYVEPFAGSLAVLLCRDPAPTPKHTETVNDIDGLLVNAWRAIKWAPEATAKWAAWPVTETDQNARHAWLVGKRESMTAQLEADPEWFDAKAAGWWIWGACCWIGSGWCEVKTTGRGVNRQLPNLGDTGRGVNRQLPHLGNTGREDWVREQFGVLAARLHGVRISCGRWERLLGSDTVMHHIRRYGPRGDDVTGVFLDPPYPEGAMKYSAIDDHASVYSEVAQWALANGSDPRLRIAFCGYTDPGFVAVGWSEHAWKAHGGFSNQGGASKNRNKERIWFSPHCLGNHKGQISLFDDAA